MLTTDVGTVEYLDAKTKTQNTQKPSPKSHTLYKNSLKKIVNPNLQRTTTKLEGKNRKSL